MLFGLAYLPHRVVGWGWQLPERSFGRFAQLTPGPISLTETSFTAILEVRGSTPIDCAAALVVPSCLHATDHPARSVYRSAQAMIPGLTVMPPRDLLTSPQVGSATLAEPPTGKAETLRQAVACGVRPATRPFD